MSSIRNWVVGRLQKNYAISLVGDSGLRIERPNKPEAFVFCVEPNSRDSFTLEDFEQVMKAMTELDFVVIIRRQVAHEVYERASDIGLCVDTFGELERALADELHIAGHIDKDQKYFRRRVQFNPAVKHIRRRGARAFEISRRDGMAPVVVVTNPDYELTSDGVYQILESYPEFKVHAVVSTNPYVSGLSPDALRTGRQTDTRVLILSDFLDQLSDAWD